MTAVGRRYSDQQYLAKEGGKQKSKPGRIKFSWQKRKEEERLGRAESTEQVRILIIFSRYQHTLYIESLFSSFHC